METLTQRELTETSVDESGDNGRSVGACRKMEVKKTIKLTPQKVNYIRKLQPDQRNKHTVQRRCADHLICP